jgi:hypothetical protein
LKRADSSLGDDEQNRKAERQKKRLKAKNHTKKIGKERDGNET